MVEHCAVCWPRPSCTWQSSRCRRCARPDREEREIVRRRLDRHQRVDDGRGQEADWTLHGGMARGAPGIGWNKPKRPISQPSGMPPGMVSSLSTTRRKGHLSLDFPANTQNLTGAYVLPVPTQSSEIRRSTHAHGYCLSAMPRPNRHSARHFPPQLPAGSFPGGFRTTAAPCSRHRLHVGPSSEILHSGCLPSRAIAKAGVPQKAAHLLRRQSRLDANQVVSSTQAAAGHFQEVAVPSQADPRRTGVVCDAEQGSPAE